MILDIGLRLVFAIAVAFAIAYAATPIVKTLSFKIGAIDIPKDERRMHKRPIPTIGGVAIFYGALISILCFCNVDSQLMGVLLGAVIIVSLGVLDDILDLSALFKFLIQILAALLVVLHGVKIEYVTNPFVSGQYISLGMWAVPLTVFWIVGVTNAFNLIDGTGRTFRGSFGNFGNIPFLRCNFNGRNKPCHSRCRDSGLVLRFSALQQVPGFNIHGRRPVPRFWALFSEA